MQEKLISIVGPTAVGKTKLSIHLATLFHGEIISADSMQVYKGMDIGTAKITASEMAGIPHHLLDILEPWETYSVSRFQEEATQLITEINQRGKLPIMVGGTGLYVQAVTHSFSFAPTAVEEKIRGKWEKFAEQFGQEAVYQELLQRDPLYAKELHPNNVRRVIRALEIIEKTGQSMANYQQDWEKASPYQLIMIGLMMEREQLYQRINQRVEQMITAGLIEEVEQLLAQGMKENQTALQAIGYKEIIQFLHGELSKVEAIELLKRNTRRFAKRQLTWFRRMKEITWFDCTQLANWQEIEENITRFVKESLSR